MSSPSLSESLGVSQITPEELKTLLARGEPVVLLDVREADELVAWPFPGSVHIPLGAVLQGQPESLPEHRDVITVCSHGNRSAVAAATLGRRGVLARSLRGGLAAWNQVFDEAPILLEGGVDVLQFRRLGKGCLSYLLVGGGDAVVVDPSWQTAQYRHAAAARGAVIRHVLDTHLHADHVSGARQLAQETGAALHLNPREGFQFEGFLPVGDRDALRAGPFVLTAFAAPGHTAGGLIWGLADRALFTSDVLFLENVGRPDLHGQAQAYAHQLYRTLQRLARLPQELLVLPGHAGAETAMDFGKPHIAALGAVRSRLPLLEADEDTFVAKVAQVPDPPPNAGRILEINRRGLRVPPEEAAVLEEGPNRCSVRTQTS